MSSRLVRILQIRAFPFRHCTEFGSPSQNRTEVGRVRAGRFATKLRGGSCFALAIGQPAVFCPPSSRFQGADSSTRASGCLEILHWTLSQGRTNAEAGSGLALYH